MAATDPRRRTLFDVWSSFYDLPTVQRLVYRPVQDAVVAELERAGARRVMDVGCGTGILTRRLSRHPLITAAAGCDLSMGMLRQASARGVAALVQGDAQRLPVRSASVDAVVCTESFHWYPDPDAALAEFARVVVPGGAVVIALVNVRTRAQSESVHALTSAAGQPVRWPTRREIADRVSCSGLELVSQRPVVRLFGLSLPTVVTVARRPA